MTSHPVRRLALTGMAGAWLALVGISVWSARAASPPQAELLPDLVQEPPSDLTVTRVRGRDLLGFRSAVANAGDGPLIIDGARPSRAVRDMRADQLIRMTDGSTRRIRSVGFVRYVTSPDHSHWHFLPFERYELRRDGSAQRLVRDAKTGFCLGDRYRMEPAPPGAVVQPAYVTQCGLRNPRRLTIREGISVGWGDDYAAYLDGQHIDVTNVPNGRYRLVHIADPGGRLRETTRANNVASVRIALTRGPTGRVRVRLLR